MPVLPYFLSFAAGAMIYVVVEELVPEMAEGEHSNWGTNYLYAGVCFDDDSGCCTCLISPGIILFQMTFKSLNVSTGIAGKIHRFSCDVAYGHMFFAVQRAGNNFRTVKFMADNT